MLNSSTGEKKTGAIFKIIFYLMMIGPSWNKRNGMEVAEFWGKKCSWCSLCWCCDPRLDRSIASYPIHQTFPTPREYCFEAIDVWLVPMSYSGLWVQTNFWPIAGKQYGTNSAIGGGPITEDDGYLAVQNLSSTQPYSLGLIKYDSSFSQSNDNFAEYYVSQLPWKGPPGKYSLTWALIEW